MYFVCVPRLLRRRDDHAMAAALLRALGLLFHLLRSHLVPDEVEWRGLLLAAGQLRSVWNSNLQPDFNVSVRDSLDATFSAALRDLDESHRFVQKSAESTSM
jgi:hypothetical protein